ncbi:MAG: hypothetical protein A2538_01665 [Candidatus Magasanikbacteria bacterium RIFOXYD2_FULL_41_14]|uniref:Probable transcriptional regulatory protein A2538_01665 n=1 Tax=Candidatus Magasanikbacteria bacterium RIFOXYD2_FULL_41_14 TaxID=1798709 RepID=A0A1F6PDL3_9BACT|nr:MAG: hypothetical protein A2538_01665 [Candidatus Magasanikbacteria bacterium RIFOXYD2_FULL_41_14]
MSGHSKWHNIQGRKGKQDAKKGVVFSMYAKKIAIAAKAGSDMATNFSLRLLVEKARAVAMPKDNIDRAIKRGTGEDKSAAQIEECMYEGYGPNGVAILIKTLSDNKNRTVSDLKHLLDKFGGSMGAAGSVVWMFEQKGFAQFKISDLGFQIDDEKELELIEVGAEDISKEDEQIYIKTKVEHLQNVVNKLKEMGVEVNESGLIFEAKDKVPVAEENKTRLENVFEALEENEDVDEFFTNAE